MKRIMYTTLTLQMIVGIVGVVLGIMYLYEKVDGEVLIWAICVNLVVNLLSLIIQYIWAKKKKGEN